jgi:hypothetical protein
VTHKNTLWHDGVHRPVHSTPSNTLTIITLGVHPPVQFPRFRLLGIDNTQGKGAQKVQHTPKLQTSMGVLHPKTLENTDTPI